MDHALQGWSLEELVERSGVSARTIRFYITERLLPGPRARGKAASYGEEHLLRLRLIRALTEQRRPLGEIGQRLAGLSPEDLRALAHDEGERAATLKQIAEARSPKAYIAALLEDARQARIAMSPAPSAPGAPTGGIQEASVAVGRMQTWRRWELAPGVELHVSDDVERAQQPLIERILQVAQEIERPRQQQAPGPAQPRLRRKAQQ